MDGLLIHFSLDVGPLLEKNTQKDHRMVQNHKNSTIHPVFFSFLILLSIKKSKVLHKINKLEKQLKVALERCIQP